MRRSLLASPAVVVACSLFLAGDVALAAPADPAASSRLKLAPCSEKGMPPGARCGTYTVFEDRDAGAGRTIDLRLVVVPATGGGPVRHAVTCLAGGPGDAATGAAAPFAEWLAAVRADRDLLFVDQRGTGGSNPLRCPYQEEQRRLAEYLEDPFAVGRLQECRRELERRADLTLYTTPYAADDLDEVRAALGYESLDLVGFSYGTRLAQVYARRHPQHARTATLLGPVPVDARMPLRLAADFDAALRATFADCRADAACAAAFPDLPGDLELALARVAAGVPPVAVPSPRGEGTVEIAVSRPLLLQALRYMLYQPATQAGLPLALHRAAAGDFRAVASFAALIGAGFNRGADGLYLAVTCAEDVPRFTLEEGRAAAAGTLIGDLRVDVQKEACALWPTGRLPAGYHDPVRVETPTVLVVGERDPATPPAWARELVTQLPNSLLVVVPRAGHDTDGMVGGECLSDLPARFIVAGSVAGLDVSCAATARLPPWALAAEPTVPLSAAQRAEVPGTYSGADGLTVAITAGEGGLRLAAMERSFILEPLSADHFRIAGAPPGFAVAVERGADGRITGIVLEQGPGKRTPLARTAG